MAARSASADATSKLKTASLRALTAQRPVLQVIANSCQPVARLRNATEWIAQHDLPRRRACIAHAGAQTPTVSCDKRRGQRRYAKRERPTRSSCHPRPDSFRAHVHLRRVDCADTPCSHAGLLHADRAASDDKLPIRRAIKSLQVARRKSREEIVITTVCVLLLQVSLAVIAFAVIKCRMLVEH